MDGPSQHAPAFWTHEVRPLWVRIGLSRSESILSGAPTNKKAPSGAFIVFRVPKVRILQSMKWIDPIVVVVLRQRVGNFNPRRFRCDSQMRLRAHCRILVDCPGWNDHNRGIDFVNRHQAAAGTAKRDLKPDRIGEREMCKIFFAAQPAKIACRDEGLRRERGAARIFLHCTQ